MKRSLARSELEQLSELIAAQMGLHFPPERAEDLERGLDSSAREFGFTDPVDCLRWLLAKPLSTEQLEILAGNLTIGETYFFREPLAFDLLAKQVLPELVQRHGDDRRLRIWSAACCSGEEPYSLAIALQRAMPDLADWHVTIRGTDLNPRFLRKAEEGIFSEWSFRNAPPWLKADYFKPLGGGRWKLSPAIKRMVSFSPLNLVDDVYPTLSTDTNAMDVIFCRNVLIYFSPERANRVIGQLARCLTEGGWLVLSPSETPHVRLPDFEPMEFGGTIVHRKESAQSQKVTPCYPAEEEWITPALEDPVDWSPPTTITPALPGADLAPVAMETPPSPADEARGLYGRGHYVEAATLLETQVSTGTGRSEEMALLTRTLANLGRLEPALEWADRAAVADKMNPAMHYLRASILVELRETSEAMLAFKRTLYLDPDFVLAHFSLGNLARGQGRTKEAHRCLTNTLVAVQQLSPDAVLPEADGLTAGRLGEVVLALLAADGVALPAMKDFRS